MFRCESYKYLIGSIEPRRVRLPAKIPPAAISHSLGFAPCTGEYADALVVTLHRVFPNHPGIVRFQQFEQQYILDRVDDFGV